jgi:hypothetical protein
MNLPEFNYRGARALVIMHEQEMRKFCDCWRVFSASGLSLAPCDDPDYGSAVTLVSHVLGASRLYMVWTCEKLGLPDPEIDKPPLEEELPEMLNKYLDHLLAAWEKPLALPEEERFYLEEYKTNWNVTYCIDSMLEHAVMHPKRHRFQLEELMQA